MVNHGLVCMLLVGLTLNAEEVANKLHSGPSAYHTCAISNSGSAKCWGLNTGGQLGIGSTENIGDAPGEMGYNLLAVDVGTGRSAVEICCGEAHTCARLDDNSMKCWGGNGYGQLGMGSTTTIGDTSGQMGDDLVSIDLGTSRTAVEICCGSHHTCARLDDNSMSCWGRGDSGQLGSGGTSNVGDSSGEMGDSLVAIDLGTGRTAVEISCGAYHTCARLDDNSMKCWGQNSYGQLGIGSTSNEGDSSGEMGDSLVAVDLGASRTAAEICCGSEHTCARLNDNSLTCWGHNGYGQLGIGSTNHVGDTSGEMGDNLVTIDLGTSRTTVEISCGHYHTCARLDDDSMSCWGRNVHGALGIGSTSDVGKTSGQMGDNLVALDLGTGLTATAIQCGAYNTCASLDDASIKCWGHGGNGQLGVGSTDNVGDNAGEMGDSLVAVELVFGTSTTSGTVSSSTTSSRTVSSSSSTTTTITASTSTSTTISRTATSSHTSTTTTTISITISSTTTSSHTISSSITITTTTTSTSRSTTGCSTSSSTTSTATRSRTSTSKTSSSTTQTSSTSTTDMSRTSTSKTSSSTSSTTISTSSPSSTSRTSSTTMTITSTNTATPTSSETSSSTSSSTSTTTATATSTTTATKTATATSSITTSGISTSSSSTTSSMSARSTTISSSSSSSSSSRSSSRTVTSGSAACLDMLPAHGK